MAHWKSAASREQPQLQITEVSVKSRESLLIVQASCLSAAVWAPATTTVWTSHPPMPAVLLPSNSAGGNACLCLSHLLTSRFQDTRLGSTTPGKGKAVPSEGSVLQGCPLHKYLTAAASSQSIRVVLPCVLLEGTGMLHCWATVWEHIFSGLA